MKKFDFLRLFQLVFAGASIVSACMVACLFLRACREEKAFDDLAALVHTGSLSEGPEGEGPDPGSPYAPLKEQNGDFYGWISIEG